MRILHLADLHLGKIFYGIHQTDDQAYVLDQAVRLVRDENVAVVAIAGDVYDRSVPPVEATELLDDFLSRIILECGAKVVMIPGNHDSAERLSFGSRLLRERGLFLAGDPLKPSVPVVLEDAAGPVTFLPIPYVEPVSLRRCLEDPEVCDFNGAYRKILGMAPQISGRSVCVAHCFTHGGAESDSERPLAVGGVCGVDPSLFSSFNLTLLGHLHRPQNPAGNVFYSGSPLRYSFSEIGYPKQFHLYDLDAAGAVTRQLVDIAAKRELRRIEGTLDEVLAGAEADNARHDYLWITLTDPGALFDYAAKLREAYPNVVSITRELPEGTGVLPAAAEMKKLSDMEILRTFFREVGGSDPAEEETEILNALLERVQGDEEVTACAR